MADKNEILVIDYNGTEHKISGGIDLKFYCEGATCRVYNKNGTLINFYHYISAGYLKKDGKTT